MRFGEPVLSIGLLLISQQTRGLRLVGEAGMPTPCDAQERDKPTGVRPDMQYCFRSGRFRLNLRTKHISVPPRHMTKSFIPDFNMISQHYRYKDTTSHTIG